jgi:hypothetical protein
MKAGTVALVVRRDEDTQEQESFSLVDVICDDHEIGLFEAALQAGEEDPMGRVVAYRERQSQEDSEFGDYVEELLSQPFVRPEIQEHGVQWLKSKIRIEQYRKKEFEAAKIIAEYALKVFQKDREQKDFFIAGPSTAVRIRIFVMHGGKARNPSEAA